MFFYPSGKRKANNQNVGNRIEQVVSEFVQQCFYFFDQIEERLHDAMDEYHQVEAQKKSHQKRETTRIISADKLMKKTSEENMNSTPTNHNEQSSVCCGMKCF